jgi:hypothetical protein
VPLPLPTVRCEPLGTAGCRRSASLLSTIAKISSSRIHSNRPHPHATIKPFHLTQFCHVQGFLSTRECTVDLYLQVIVCNRVEQEVIERSRENAAGGVRTGDDGQLPILRKLVMRWSFIFEEFLAALSSRPVKRRCQKFDVGAYQVIE